MNKEGFDRDFRLAKYSELLNRIGNIETNQEHGEQTIRKCGEIFTEINAMDQRYPLEERINCLDETVMDSTLLSSASGTFVKTVGKIPILGCTYDAADFATRIISSMEDVDLPEPWHKYLGVAHSFIRDGPNLSLLYGAMDEDLLPKPKPVRERLIRENQEAALKKPEVLANAQEEIEGSDDNINIIFKALKREYERNHFKPVDYFDFIIDLESFSKTIENMFYFSFLVKDGKANFVTRQDDPGPKIEPLTQIAVEELKEKNSRNVQILTSFSVDDWKRFKSNNVLPSTSTA